MKWERAQGTWETAENVLHLDCGGGDMTVWLLVSKLIDLHAKE